MRDVFFYYSIVKMLIKRNELLAPSFFFATPLFLIFDFLDVDYVCLTNKICLYVCFLKDIEFSFSFFSSVEKYF